MFVHCIRTVFCGLGVGMNVTHLRIGSPVKPMISNISTSDDNVCMGHFKVRDIMTTDVVTLSPNNTVREAVRKLAVENLTGAPVVDNDNHMVGIVSQNDILGLILAYDAKLRKKGTATENLLASYIDGESSGDPEIDKATEDIANTKIGDIMVRTVLMTSPDDLVMSLLKSMVDMDVSRVPVVDRGVLLGIVTRGDILFTIYKKKLI